MCSLPAPDCCFDQQREAGDEGFRKSFCAEHDPEGRRHLGPPERGRIDATPSSGSASTRIGWFVPRCPASSTLYATRSPFTPFASLRDPTLSTLRAVDAPGTPRSPERSTVDTVPPRRSDATTHRPPTTTTQRSAGTPRPAPVVKLYTTAGPHRLADRRVRHPDRRLGCRTQQPRSARNPQRHVRVRPIHLCRDFRVP